MWIEIIGIIATIIILIAMCINTQTWKGDVVMRIINIVGSIVFAVYGFLLPAYSTGILNGLLVFVNSYHLIKLFKNKQQLLAAEQSVTKNTDGDKNDVQTKQNKKTNTQKPKK